MDNESSIPPPRSLQEIVGSLLFASETPLTAGEIRAAVKAVEPEEGGNAEVMEIYRTCTSREIDEALKGLAKALDVAGCGFSLVCTGGTYRLQTTPSCGRYVRAMLKMDRPSRLGRASLETLAIIAYRQPITKSEIEEIRGVDVSANVKTLMDLQLIRLVGKSELPGHPFLYGTTPLFLEHFGLASLQELNKIDPTLQRSNPRLKAEAYKRPKPAETDQLPLEGGTEEAEEPVESGKSGGSGESGMSGDSGESEDSGKSGEPGTSGETADDDDIFIDDTPDEFDDEDEEDDELDEDEDGEEEGDGDDDEK
jgi:segregation and condensation protein B